MSGTEFGYPLLMTMKYFNGFTTSRHVCLLFFTCCNELVHSGEIILPKWLFTIEKKGGGGSIVKRGGGSCLAGDEAAGAGSWMSPREGAQEEHRVAAWSGVCGVRGGRGEGG